MDQFDQYMFPFDERPRATGSHFVELSFARRPRGSAVLLWSGVSASHAPVPNAPVPNAPVPLEDTETDDLLRTAGLWGTRRPPGGRARRSLARGRRVTDRVRPTRPPRDPNRDCRVFIDFAGDGFYAMTMQVRGEAPVVIERTEHAADLVFGAGMRLAPGLKASVSEAAMLAAMLGFQVWSPKELLRNKRDLGRDIRVRVLDDNAEVERVAEVGFRHFAVSSRWAHAAFGSFLSKKQLRLIWKREDREDGRDGRDGQAK